MTNIVKQYGELGCLKLLLVNLNTFGSEVFQDQPHQVHGPQSMLETRVQSAGKNQISKTKLPNVSQPLEPGVHDDVEDKFGTNGNESVDRVVDDFFLIHLVCYVNAEVVKLSARIVSR